MFYVAIVFAGGIGVLFRYLLGRAAVNLGWAALPFGTLIANLLGCFLMGYFSWVLAHRWSLNGDGQAVVLTGFLGGFTTFSAFSLETVSTTRRISLLMVSGPHSQDALSRSPNKCVLFIVHSPAFIFLAT